MPETFFSHVEEKAYHHKKLKIPLVQDHKAEHEYSIFVYVDHEWFELVRQSEKWLKATFNYNKTGGYTILGRRSIRVWQQVQQNSSTLEFVGYPDVSRIKMSRRSRYREIDIAKGLLELIWKESVKLGPTSKSYTDFMQQSFEVKLLMVRNSEFSVMCQGMRDLFLPASVGVKNFKARAIEAFNYNRKFPELVSYGHSSVEIWIEALGKWILFDPWYAIIVVDVQGVPIGVQELQRQNPRNSGYKVVPMMDKIVRRYQRSNGVVENVLYSPSQTKLWDFSCGKAGCSPGYYEYFRYVIYRHYEIIN